LGIFSLDPSIQVILIPVLVFALSFHEFAHGWMAHRLGDSTAKNQGRLTLNPLAHLDPIGALVLYFAGFGWAKPVPVDGSNLANPRTDMMKIAFAGPASNLLLALIGGVLLRILIGSSFVVESLTYYASSNFIKIVFETLIRFTQINIALAVFNLIPIPPLDGSQIFSGLIVQKNPDLVMKLQMYGPQILFGLILVGYFIKIPLLWWVISPFVSFFMLLFSGMTF